MRYFKVIFFLACIATAPVQAQFLNSVGIAGGITYGDHKWDPSEFNTQERSLLGFNIAALAEFSQNKRFRWRVEVEYNQMGSKELVYTMYKNRTTYITLNNYLKIQYRLDWFMPYLLIGPRLEYLLINSPQKYGDDIGAFPKIWFTGAVGVGFEFVNKSLFRPFIEGFYNRDILPSNRSKYTVPGTPPYEVTQTIYYIGLEARVGIRYIFDYSKRKAKCPKVITNEGAIVPTGVDK